MNIITFLHWINEKDEKLLQILDFWVKNRVFDKFMFFITYLGGFIFTSSIFLLYILLPELKLINIAIAVACTQLIIHILKALFHRSRPNNYSDINLFIVKSFNDFSFPSGHTATAFTLATVLAYNFDNLTMIFFIISALVGFSRVYLKMHYATDVFIGALIGYFSALIPIYFI